MQYNRSMLFSLSWFMFHVSIVTCLQVAILHEGDEPGVVTKLTYEELLRQVCRVANAMREVGVKKGDFVTLYMPMVPEAAVAMLACARLGAPHSVVFAGFSAEALRDRIVVRSIFDEFTGTPLVCRFHGCDLRHALLIND